MSGSYNPRAAPLGMLDSKRSEHAMTQPDIFTNVHKGLRKALFETCVALGRASDGDGRDARARALLAETLTFVAHHGENEDVLLLPRLARALPDVYDAMTSAHGQVNGALEALRAAAAQDSMQALYTATCDFTALYLEHMRVEESELEPHIRAAMAPEELAQFGRDAVARTPPDQQRLMLAFMLPAMTRPDAEGFLSRLPEELAAELRPRALGDAP
jgi:hypothetical protein